MSPNDETIRQTIAELVDKWIRVDFADQLAAMEADDDGTVFRYTEQATAIRNLPPMTDPDAKIVWNQTIGEIQEVVLKDDGWEPWSDFGYLVTTLAQSEPVFGYISGDTEDYSAVATDIEDIATAVASFGALDPHASLFAGRGLTASEVITIVAAINAPQN